MTPFLWSDLPEELLEIIFKRLSNCVDVFRCGVVCVSWRSVAIHIYRELIPQLPPLLLLPNNGEEGSTRSLFNISTNKIYGIHLPEARGRWCCSSTNGWLLTIGCTSPDEIHLLNPFSRTQFQLPPRSTFRNPQLDEETYTEGYIKRAISSSNPLDPSCITLVIHCNQHRLAFCKAGDEKWKTLDAPQIAYRDIIFFEGQFYATDVRGNIVHCDLSPNLKATRVAPPIRRDCLEHKYLVESSGDFLMVLRHLDWDDFEDDDEVDTYFYKTVLFEVFKLDLTKKEWSEVKSLGDRALFLGQNRSISVSSRDSTTCRRNCIYFTDDYWEGYLIRNLHGCHDMGIYDLGTRRFEQLYQSPQIWSSPFHWITPDLSQI